jgi:hypothetical protein
VFLKPCVNLKCVSTWKKKLPMCGNIVLILHKILLHILYKYYTNYYKVLLTKYYKLLIQILYKLLQVGAWSPTCLQRCRLGSSMIPLRRLPPPSPHPPPPYLHAMSRRSCRRHHRHQRDVAFSSPPRYRPPPLTCACRCCRWMPFF